MIQQNECAENIISRKECCRFLNITEAAFKDTERKLHPVKKQGDEALYLQGEILDLKSKRTKVRILFNSQKLQPIFGGFTCYDASCRFLQAISDFNDISTIRFYLYWSDAILDGYYTYESDANDTPVHLEAPTCIVNMKDNSQLWFRNLNCGYVGTGPRTSIELLRKIGISSEEITHAMYTASIIEFYRENNTWSYEILACADNTSGIHMRRTSFYSHDNNLVFAYDSSEHSLPYEDMVLRFIQDSAKFMPEPTQVTIMQSKTARDKGYFIKESNRETNYCIVIKDEYNREIWLPCLLNENQMVYRQSSLQDILSFYGFEISESYRNQMDKSMQNWLASSSFSLNSND